MVRVAVAGAAGAFGMKHLGALAQIEQVQVTSVIGRTRESIEPFARDRNIGHATTDLAETLARDDVDAVILSTPTQMHAAQSIQCLQAGKHVLCEIPMSDSVKDAEAVVKAHQATDLVGMAGQVRRFNPSHQYLHKRIQSGDLAIQQMDVQTYFFRRSNMNAMGNPRSWTDHLLWHHACHTVDLFMYQTGEVPTEVFALQGPEHPELGIAMDMSIGLKTPTGKLCTLSLSFNNDGPLGTFFRYICDNGTYIARYDDLVDGRENPIDLSDVAVSNNGIELIDREFVSAIVDQREPNGSFAQVLPAMQVLDRLEKALR
jgi:2-hydroxy-4-carboxymuconate semialdehyde hemiacetal dehydrogenase